MSFTALVEATKEDWQLITSLNRQFQLQLPSVSKIPRPDFWEEYGRLPLPFKALRKLMRIFTSRR